VFSGGDPLVIPSLTHDALKQVIRTPALYSLRSCPFSTELVWSECTLGSFFVSFNEFAP
jgi:hypothetical protein